MFSLPTLSLKGKVSDKEWQTRVDLAACYRLVADMRWGDLIYTHISAKVPGTDHYLVNAFGLTFDEVTASNLVKVDLAGNILDDTPYGINPAGFTIHSAIHEVRHDAQCVIHLHTLATISVASVKGTELSIVSDPVQGDSFVLLEGLIEVTNSITGETMEVNEGETAVSTPDGSLDVRETTEEDLDEFVEAEAAAEGEIQELRFEVEDANGNIKEIIIQYQ